MISFRAALLLSVLLVPAIAEAREPINVFGDDDKDDASPQGSVIINGRQATGEAEGNAGVIRSSGVTGANTGAGAMRVKFERRGGTMYVKAKVRGRPVYFLLDTGASFTTLTPAFARSIGIRVPKNAPAMRLRTANGVTSSRLGVIDSMIFGGRPHRNVTFVECPTCGGTFKGKPLVGLLGMNVLGRYRMDVIEQSREIVFIPGMNYSNRFADIEPWLTSQPVKRQRSVKGNVTSYEVTVAILNRAPRAVSDVEFGLVCTLANGQERRASGKVARIKKGKVAKTKITLKADGPCTGIRPAVFQARW